MHIKDLLKEYVKEIINERAVTTSDAISDGLALATIQTSVNEWMYVLYDPKTLLAILHSSNDDVIENALEQSNKYLKGMIKIFDGHKDEAWDAAEVTLSAADKGYGPLMYDIAMNIHGRIMADRALVSPSAKGVWDKYLKSRPDVDKLRLDNVNDPKTIPTEDDAALYEPDEPNNPLNYAYQTKEAIGLERLDLNHVTALNRLERYNIDDDFFRSLGQILFRKKYTGS